MITKAELQEKYDKLVEQGHADTARIASQNNKIVDLQKNLNDADRETDRLKCRMDAVRLALKTYSEAHVEAIDVPCECEKCAGDGRRIEYIDDPAVRYMRLLAGKLSTEEPLIAGQVAYYAR